jgi:hypothetical protein
MPAETSVTTEQSSYARESHHQLACPVCSGLLVPLRGSVRCARCGFTFCEGCEGGMADLCSADD